MNTRQLIWRVSLSLILVLLAGGTLACAQEATGPRAWIDVPLDGSSLPAGTPVAVVSHAYAPDGVAEILLNVNGQAYRRNPPAQPGESFSEASLDWLPTQEGDYVLQVIAYSKNGQASQPATARVRATGKATPTPLIPIIPPLTPVISITPPLDVRTVTPVPLPDLEIVSVEAMYAGVKGGTPFCNTRVTYRNAGMAAVPADFSIQFHYNSTPQLENKVAGGLAPGATGQIIFVYQFVGSPYIGINLDSTSEINESNELNNAFAEARLCSGPASVISPTLPPTPTRTPTIGIPPPSACSGTPLIASFAASPATITQGQSSTLSWDAVTNADSVSIDPGIGGVGTPGSRAVSPNSTTTYTLMARCGGSTATRQVTLTVLPVVRVITPTFTPTRTHTPPPPVDNKPPAIPNPLDPTGGKAVACSGTTGSATLRWSSVSDPSGVTYYVKWSGAGQTGGWQGSGTSHAISVKCGYGYSWQVRACDGKSNCSNWSSSATFTTGTLH